MTTLQRAQREFTAQYVRQAIATYGSKRRAAKEIGLDRSSMYRLLRAEERPSPPCGTTPHLVTAAESR